jgi:glucose-6-phosphate 1-dehydrogenase
MALTDFDLVLFGGSGDLAMRKLLPAMFVRDVANDLPASALHHLRRPRRRQSGRIPAHHRNRRRNQAIKATTVSAAAWAKFTARITYVSLNATDAGTYHTLVDAARKDDAITKVYYLATPPAIFSQICENLKANGPHAEPRGAGKTAGPAIWLSKQINARVGKVFEESQIYRIDHYLGKETVQNLLALRFGNTV